MAVLDRSGKAKTITIVLQDWHQFLYLSHLYLCTSSSSSMCLCYVDVFLISIAIYIWEMWTTLSRVNFGDGNGSWQSTKLILRWTQRVPNEVRSWNISNRHHRQLYKQFGTCVNYFMDWWNPNSVSVTFRDPFFFKTPLYYYPYYFRCSYKVLLYLNHI